MNLKQVKKAAMVLTALILILLPVTPARADDDFNDPWLVELIRLQQENEQLRQQLEDANRPQPPAQINAPNPRLLSPQQVTFEPGETRDVTLTIRNIGTQSAFNVLTQAVPAAGSPFTVEFVGNSNIASSIRENGQHTMTLRIAVNANAAPGSSHTITLHHLFRDGDRDNSSTSDVLHVNIAGEETGQSNLEIRNMSAPTGAIGVGETATITFSVHNSGDAEARNVRVVAAAESAADVVPVQTASTQTIQSLAPGQSQQLTFSFSPRNSATTRSYAIGFTVYDGDLSFQQFAAINVYNPEPEDNATDDTLANLGIRNMTAPTGVLNVGQTATISFDVYNRGDAEARNIRVVAAPETPDVVPVQTANQQVIASLAPGEYERLTFSFAPRESAITRSYAIGFTVHYGELSFQQFAAINVFNPEPAEDEDPAETGRVQIPRVIVSAIDIDPPMPRAGQPFDMEVTFRNTSATRSVNNIRILMEEVLGAAIGGQSAPFAGFTPLGGSNTIFVDYLAPHGEITMNLRFSTVVEATPGAHNMRFSFDYQDQDFYSHEASQQISISVAQVTRLELARVNVGGWSTPTMGMEVPFDFTIINSGRVNLINVRVRAEGPFDRDQAGGEEGVHVGQINAQRSVGFDGAFFPLEAGELEGNFIITGEDITGEIVELVHPFTIWVEGGFDFGDDGFREGGGFDDGGFARPGMEMGEMPPGEVSFDPETGAMLAGTRDWETGEFTPTHELDPETGEWREIGGGFDLLVLIRRPIVWGPAIGVVVILAVVIIAVVVRRKKSAFDFDED